jgi:hypothetical protein
MAPRSPGWNYAILRNALMRRCSAAAVRVVAMHWLFDSRQGSAIRLPLGSSRVDAAPVRSWIEREEAERVAWSTPAVTKVEDHIVASP